RLAVLPEGGIGTARKRILSLPLRVCVVGLLCVPLAAGGCRPADEGEMKYQAMLPGQTETYQLTDPAFLEDPYPVYRRMRQQGPVYWSEALGHWVLTRYDDVLAGIRHPALSSARTEVFVRAQVRGSGPALAADYTRIQKAQMIMKDGPEHHRLRVLGNHAFTLSALKRWQSVIERVVDDLLDAALPRGRMDLIDDLAGPLPDIVIAELFGIPPEDREMFHQWSRGRALLRRCGRRPRRGSPRRQRGRAPPGALLPRPAGGAAAPAGRRPDESAPAGTGGRPVECRGGLCAVQPAAGRRPHHHHGPARQ